MKVFVLAAIVVAGLMTAFVATSFFPQAVAATDN